MCQFIPEIVFVMETSAKENTNIEDAFVCLATELKVCQLHPAAHNLLFKFFFPIQQRRYDNMNVEVDDAITLGQGKSVTQCSASNCSLT